MNISKKEKLKIIQHILNGVEEYWMDTQGVIYATNLEATGITGYEEYEVIGKHFSLLYPEDDRNHCIPQSEIFQVMHSGFLILKGIRTKKNKQNFIAKVQFEMINRENGELAIKMTLQDNTYKAVNKYKLKTVESHFNSLFHNNFIGVINLHHNDYKILTANSKAIEVIGDEDLINKNFDYFIKDSASREKFYEATSQAATNTFEIQVTRWSGTQCWLSMRSTYFAAEEIIELLIFDITGEKKTINELERINHHLDQFIYHASHDLRSPLTTLLGLLQLSKKESSSMVTIQSYIDLMIERTKHLDSLLIDLTSIAFNEKATLDVEEVNFDKEAEAVLSEYSLNAISCSYQVRGNKGGTFFTDVKRLRVILRNLISNAVKYSNPATETPYVKLTISVQRENAVIEIEDNGIGIHAQHTEKIYTMFFRGTERSSGTGLGLYIVKAMVEKLNGRIDMISTPNIGSVFTVSFPNQKRNKEVSRLSVEPDVVTSKTIIL